MARPSSVTREAVLRAAVEIVRREGEERLSARNVGRHLGCSVRPLFTLYENMEEFRRDVRRTAVGIFWDYVRDCLDYVPALKEYGLRLVRFARTDNNLFRMIFFSPDMTFSDFGPQMAVCRDAMAADYGLSDSQAWHLMRSVWIHACGLAMLCQSGALSLSDEEISDALSEQFVGAFSLMRSGRDVSGVIPARRESEDAPITLKV